MHTYILVHIKGARAHLIKPWYHSAQMNTYEENSATNFSPTRFITGRRSPISLFFRDFIRFRPMWIRLFLQIACAALMTKSSPSEACSSPFARHNRSVRVRCCWLLLMRYYMACFCMTQNIFRIYLATKTYLCETTIHCTIEKDL